MRALRVAMLLIAPRVRRRPDATRSRHSRVTRPMGFTTWRNSYARAGKPGLAVLNYERAALLAPDDPDINANLDLRARLRTCGD